MAAELGAPGPAITMAHRLIVAHAEGRGCSSCQDRWCPAAEWALQVAAMDDAPPPEPDGRRLVTVVARQVAAAHWPREVDGCRPCGLPDCDRYGVASAWLSQVGEPLPER